MSASLHQNEGRRMPMSIVRRELMEESLIHDFIPITSCFALHRFINGKHFQPTTGSQYVQIFNLHTLDTELKVPREEYSRFCYIIDYLARNHFTLSKRFKKKHRVDEEEEFDITPYRKEWRAMMLEMSGISLEHFKRHYRDALNSSSKKNTVLREDLEDFEKMVENMNYAIS